MVEDHRVPELLGEISGKLDSLHLIVRNHMESTHERFVAIEIEQKHHAAEINQAKGAKAAIYTMAAAISGLIALIGSVVKKALGGE